MKNTLIIILAILLFSCGPAYHLKRAKYHERMAIAKGADIKADTVFKDRVIEIPKTKLDTMVVTTPGDTVYLTKERLRIKYVNLPGDSVFIEGECKDSVITIKQPVYINKTITAKSGLPWWVYLVFGISALVIIVLCFRK